MEKSKRRLSLLRFVVILFAVSCAAGILFAVSQRDGTEVPPDETDNAEEETAPVPKFTVVLDAGHGGEDGGTSSAAGVLEKNLNLSVSLLLRKKLEKNGVKVVMTRTEDILLYDRNADYKGRKKPLDLSARLSVGENVSPDLYVSIHMNSYPAAKYHGLQVWYSPNHALSGVYADCIRAAVKTELQPENNRETKAAGSNIYLLHHLSCPAVLVECGFLSNPEEAELLSTAEYQEKLADTLCRAILDGLTENAT